MKKAAHVQGPEKFACQNEAVISSLRAGDSTLAAHLRKFFCTYVTLPQVARVPLRKPSEPYCTDFLIPPILAARIFPSPGQREKPISLSTQIFSHLPPAGEARWGEDDQFGGFTFYKEVVAYG
jgi:hypothetical protein